jgi:hypothetical protein
MRELKGDAAMRASLVASSFASKLTSRIVSELPTIRELIGSINPPALFMLYVSYVVQRAFATAINRDQAIWPSCLF